MIGQGVLRMRAAGEGPYANAPGEQTLGDVPSRIAEGSGDYGEVGVGHLTPYI